MAITRPNQVWAMDITYIPMARGFVYLAVVLSTGTELSQNVGFQFSLGGDGGVSGISRYRDRGLPFREVFRGAFALAVD
jgi:transposase InsO family protein